MSKHLLLLLIISSFIIESFSQGVSINTTGAIPNSSAILDVSSTTQGIGLPILNQIQVDVLSKPLEATLIYNETSKQLNLYNGTEWIELKSYAVSNTQSTETGDTIGLSVGSENSHPSAILDVYSQGNKGFVLPIHNGFQMTSPPEGILFYNSITKNVHYYVGDEWKSWLHIVKDNGNLSGSPSPGIMAIGQETPDSSASLQLVSDSLGFLPTRLTSLQRDSIKSPKPGLIIYNTDDKMFELWIGHIWRIIGAGEGLFSGIGIFSDALMDSTDHNNIKTMRNAWHDNPNLENSTPCSSQSSYFNLDSLIISIENEQSDAIIVTAPAPFPTIEYIWKSPNGEIFNPGNILTIPKDSAFAYYNGEWNLVVKDSSGCVVNGSKFKITLPLQENQNKKGIFSGTTNNMNVQRDSWRDPIDSLNSGPCNNTPFIDFTSSTIIEPIYEQNDTLKLIAPIGGSIYEWTSPNGYFTSGNNYLLLTDSVIASHSGQWKLVIRDTDSCVISGTKIDVTIPLQTTHKKGIFSGFTNNVFVNRDSWRDNIDSTNSGPCNETPSIDLSLTTVTLPTAEQSSVLTLNAPTDGTTYYWTSPNGSAYTGNPLTIPTDSALASHSGAWTLLVRDNERCFMALESIDVVIKLQNQQSVKGIFSGSTNNIAVHRDAWRDNRDSTNTGPCSGNLDFTGTTIIAPNFEQVDSLKLSAPVGGIYYEWYSPNGLLARGNPFYISPDSTIASHNGSWKLVIRDVDSCVISGGRVEVVLPLQTTHKKGVFSGATNNMFVNRDSWRDNIDSTNSGPCNATPSIDLSLTSIILPSAEQSSLLSLSAPINGTFYYWTSPNGTAHTGNPLTIATNDAFASNNGAWDLLVRDHQGCFMANEAIDVSFPLQNQQSKKGIFSGSTNNMSVQRENWRDNKDSLNTGPCSTYLNFAGTNIIAPQFEQGDSLKLSAPIGGDFYEWTSPNGLLVEGNPYYIMPDSAIASHNGNWKVVIKDSNDCIISGGNIEVLIPLQTNNKKGIFSGSTNNMFVNRDSWRDMQDSTNSGPCNATPYIDLVSSTITIPPFEQTAIMSLNAPIGGTEYIWTAPNGSIYNGNPYNIPADSAFAKLSGKWSLIVKDDNNCIISGRKFDVTVPLQTNTQNKGIFSGTTNNINMHRDSWRDNSDSINTVPCSNQPIININTAIITTPSFEQTDSLLLIAPIGGDFYTWTSPTGNIYTGKNISIIPNNALASNSGNWHLIIKDSSDCLITQGNIFSTIPVQNINKKGVFSGSTNNMANLRDSWRDHADSTNLGPCSTSPYIDLSTANISTPSLEQTNTMSLNAPIGGDVYIWTSANGMLFSGANIITVSSDSALASHNGIWNLTVKDAIGCIISGTSFELKGIALQTNTNEKGIFSGSTNNMNVHRNAWRDQPDSANAQPCPYLDLTTAGIDAPLFEQTDSLYLHAPLGGNVYEWVSPKNDTINGNTATISANNTLSSLTGIWKLKVKNDEGCIMSGKPFDVRLPLQNNTKSTGIFSGSTNNTDVYRNDWQNDEDSTAKVGPCSNTSFIDISLASITEPSFDQSGTLNLNAPIGGASYVWTTPLNDTLYSNSVVILADEVLASLSGEWHLTIKDASNCVMAGQLYNVTIPLSSNFQSKGLFSGSSNNSDVFRNAWQNKPDSTNPTGACSNNTYIDLSLMSISTPTANQSGSLTLNAPIGANSYIWTTPLDTTYSTNPVVIPTIETLASLSGEWQVILKDSDKCIMSGKSFGITLPLSINHSSTGVFSGSSNNNTVFRNAWNDIKSNTNTTP